jgi:uncharacterized protein YbjT (DUF2867 family)
MDERALAALQNPAPSGRMRIAAAFCRIQRSTGDGRNTMILVSGATGTIGSALVKELQKLGARFKVLTRDPNKARAQLGNVEVAQGDFSRPETLDAAFKGVDKFFLLSNAGPTQVSEQHNALVAAKKAGVKHIVKLSAYGADANAKVSLGRWHAQTEAELKTLGPAWTILQPGAFMQNLLDQAPQIKQGTLFSSTGDGKLAMIDARDIARVAAHTLVDEGHAGKTYVITGGEAVGYADVAAQLSEVTGRPVKYMAVTDEQARQGMSAAGMPDWLVEDLLIMNGFARAGHAAQTSDVVEKVAKTKPTTFAQFARDYAQSWK